MIGQDSSFHSFAGFKAHAFWLSGKERWSHKNGHSDWSNAPALVHTHSPACKLHGRSIGRIQARRSLDCTLHYTRTRTQQRTNSPRQQNPLDDNRRMSRQGGHCGEEGGWRSAGAYRLHKEAGAQQDKEELKNKKRGKRIHRRPTTLLHPHQPSRLAAAQVVVRFAALTRSL